MTIAISDIAITSLETIQAYTLLTSTGGGEFMFELDELQNATIAQTQEKQDITGKAGRKLNSLKRNKDVTVSGTNGLLSNGLLETQVGGEFTNGATNVKWTDYLTVTGDASATNYKAVGTVGNEIAEIYIKNSDGTLGERLTQDAAVAAGKFTYDPNTKALAFNSGEIADGTEIVVRYNRSIVAHKLVNSSDKYSAKAQLYIDAFGEDKCGKIYHIQFYIPKADFNGDFDFTMGDDQAVHAFEATSLAGSCAGAGELWTYTIFEDDAADA